MAYRTRADLSFCRIDDHLIFLDVEADRYFRLPDKLERAFVAFFAGGVCEEPDIQRLIAARVLTKDRGLANIASAEPIEPACRSALELSAESSPRRLGILPEVAAIVLSARLQLATRPLKVILRRLATDRRRHTSRSSSSAALDSDHAFVDAVALFRHARLYVPVPTRCLLDSISIVRFLARRGRAANIVFGVTSAPFSAHCWAQANDLVLNDSVGNVAAYTPIRVV